MNQTFAFRTPRIPFHAGKLVQALRRLMLLGVFFAPFAMISSSCAAVLDDINTTVTNINNKVTTINTTVNRVEGKVDTIGSQATAIVTNTDGMQDLVENVRGVTSALPNGAMDDLREALQDAQALLDLAQTQAADAVANKGNYPDLVEFSTGLANLTKASMGDAGKNVNFGALTQLLEILPDKLRAVTGQGLMTAGIDQAFVEKLQQAALDVTLLEQVEQQTSQLAAPPDGPEFLTGGSNCAIWNDNREAIDKASKGAGALGKLMKLSGKIIESKAEALKVGEKLHIGIHGYALFDIEKKPLEALGKKLEGVGDALKDKADWASDNLNHCETLFYQQSLLEATCRLRRGGGVCGRWYGSAERAALINTSK
jgi:hypothetical protein